jgi:hypothetical protein
MPDRTPKQTSRIEETIDRILDRKPPAPARIEPRIPKRPMGRPLANDSAAALRVLKTLRLLQSRWCRVNELAEASGCDEKTVRRDLAVISRSRFAVQTKVEAFGRKAYRVKPTKSKAGKRRPAAADRQAAANHISLADQLRDALKESGLTMFRIAKESGVEQSVLYRFVTAERGVQMDTAEKLAAFFRMNLTPAIVRKRR